MNTSKPNNRHISATTAALLNQPAWVQAEMEALRKHEATILHALKDEQHQATFLRDPTALLAQLKIPISGPLRQKLRGDDTPAQLQQPIAFRLPDGTLLNPRITIRFK